MFSEYEWDWEEKKFGVEFWVILIFNDGDVDLVIEFVKEW